MVFMKRGWLGVLVRALVFGMVSVGCLSMAEARQVGDRTLPPAEAETESVDQAERFSQVFAAHMEHQSKIAERLQATINLISTPLAAPETIDPNSPDARERQLEALRKTVEQRQEFIRLFNAERLKLEAIPAPPRLADLDPAAGEFFDEFATFLRATVAERLAVAERLVLNRVDMIDAKILGKPDAERNFRRNNLEMAREGTRMGVLQIQAIRKMTEGLGDESVDTVLRVLEATLSAFLIYNDIQIILFDQGAQADLSEQVRNVDDLLNEAQSGREALEAVANQLRRDAQVELQNPRYSEEERRVLAAGLPKVVRA